MNPKKQLIGLCILLIILLAQPLFAGVQIGYESAAVGRIVGDTPSEMTEQLQEDTLTLNKATFFTDSGQSPYGAVLDAEEKEAVLKVSFNNNVNVDKGDVGSPWVWETVKDTINQWHEPQLLLIETKGELDGDMPVIFSPYYSQELSPITTTWLNLKTYNSLLIFNADFAGLHLPKTENFVKTLGQDAVIIAPTAVPDKNFVQVLLCNLGRFDKDLGYDYRNARNNYYWQTNFPSGLALMSYTLFGNPGIKISLPNKPYHEYCDGVVQDYGMVEVNKNYKIYKNEGFASQETLNDLYTYEATVEVDDYNFIDENNYSLIDAKGFIQSLDENYPSLPRRVEKLNLPLGTVVNKIELLETSNPITITGKNVPSWDGNFTDRLCKENNYTASIKYSHSFTDDYEVVLVEINPVEVVDCEQGIFKLYKTIKYKIDYYPDSAVLLNSVTFPDHAVPEKEIGVSVDISRIKTESVSGVLRVKQNEQVVAEKTISFDQDTYVANVIFNAPKYEGLVPYTIEFEENKKVTSRVNFNVYVSLVDAVIKIPKNIGTTAVVDIEAYNHHSEQLPITIYYELKHNDKILKSETLQKTVNPNWNLIPLTFSDLKKEDGNYMINIELYYTNYKKILSGLLVTNHPPLIEPISPIIIKEGQPITLKPNIIDEDYDEVTTTIGTPLETGIWIPNFEQAGNYNVTITAFDGYLESSQIVSIIVEDVPQDPETVIFRDCNYGLYRGGLAEISVYNYETQTLQSWYQSTSYDELQTPFVAKTGEGWPIGFCTDTTKVCIEDSDKEDPVWGEGDSFPDPIFEQGGSCEITITPLFKYKDHEVCQGNIPCNYPSCITDLDCGETAWAGEKYCQNNAVYLNKQSFTCNDAGTMEALCSSKQEPMLLQQCNADEECYEGSCTPIKCTSDADCGDETTLNYYCTNNGAYQTQRTFTCENKGTALAACLQEDKEVFMQMCDVINEICVLGQCIDKENNILGIFGDGNEKQSFVFYDAGKNITHITLPKNVQIKKSTMTIKGGEK